MGGRRFRRRLRHLLGAHPSQDHPTEEAIMTTQIIPITVPGDGLKLADDGQLHTAECVNMGWWVLDWDADCRVVGTPPGGEVAARAERALFATALAVLQLVALFLTFTGGVRRGR
jgi:hypothetical protein